jgi:hypothetical protein
MRESYNFLLRFKISTPEDKMNFLVLVKTLKKNITGFKFLEKKKKRE